MTGELPRPVGTALGDAEDRTAAHERTALAWRRTGLAVVVGATLLARLVVGRLGAVGLVAVAAAVPLGAWVFWSTGSRRQRSAGADGALLAGAVALLAAVEALALAVDAGDR